MGYWKYLYLFLFGLLLVSCQEDLLVGEAGEGEGKLILSNIKVESVVGDIQTKASLDDDNIPSSEDFTFIIVDATSGLEVKKLEPGVTECFLSAGNYKVNATYGEESCMSDIPYFYGESDEFTIADGTTNSVSITASLKCAVIRPVISEELIAQYDSYTLTISEVENSKNGQVSGLLENNKDYFVKGGDNRTYNLIFAGKNKLGEDVSHTWSYSNLVIRTRYNVNCNPDLPSFKLPEQNEGNVWSKFIYITPMTAEDITSHREDMAEKIIDNVVYEASADNGNTWVSAIKDGEKIVIKDLNPSTTYTIRSRFGGVISENTQTVTTESAQPLENGDMEDWSSTEYTTYGQKSIYLYFAGVSSSERFWGTRNSLTMSGVENGTSSGTSNQVTAYRWNSCTIPTKDAVEGNAAEIRTMALSTRDVKGTEVGSGLFWANNNVKEFVQKQHQVYNGFLYTGNQDVTSYDEIPDQKGIPHNSRPRTLEFFYKFSSYNSDNCNVYAVVYNEKGEEIARTINFQVNETQNEYIGVSLDFSYSDNEAKAFYLFIMFRSGEKESWDYVTYIDGDYNLNPWSLDTFVGSILKIDNVTLNYDYE